MPATPRPAPTPGPPPTSSPGPDLGLPVPVLVEVGHGARVATWVLEPTGRRPAGDVVLCHGTPWSARVWAPVARELSQEYRVFLWDMPGYGESSKDAAQPVDLVAQRERFAALLRRWSLERPHVVAHDIGGAVALGAHLLEDVDLASLFLLDVVTLDPWGSAFFRLVGENEQIFAAIPGPMHAALLKEYIAGAANHGLSADIVEALAEPWLGEVGQAAFYRQIAQLSPDHTAPIVNRLGRVRCPVRVGWAVDDPWIPFEQAGPLRAELPGSAEVRGGAEVPGDPQVVEFPGRGHLVPLEDADGVGRAVRQWLGELRGR